MPNWTASFHMPKFTTPEIEAASAKHIAAYGSTITIPGLDDIIHINTPRPLNEEETKRWKAKDYQFFGSERYDEIAKMKARKKEQLMRMMSSPAPTVLKNLGAILTSLDDTQDALSTLSTIGKLAIHFAPRILGKAMLGPVGWLMTAADAINLAMVLGRTVTMPFMGGRDTKRAGEKAMGESPFAKEAKLKRAAKIAHWWPTIGNMLEVLQTTDQVFGVGISLGPIVGLLEDVMTGGIRTALGQKVQLRTAPPPRFKSYHDQFQTGGRIRLDDHPSPERADFIAARGPKAAAIAMASGYKMDDAEQLATIAAYYLSQQRLATMWDEWQPGDEVPDLPKTELFAPRPSNPITIEVLEEEGITPDKYGGWPHHNGAWAKVDDVVKEYQAPARDWLRDAMEAHAHDWTGYTIGQLATGAHFQGMANLEGEDQVEYNYAEQSRVAQMMLGQNMFPDPNQPQEKLQKLIRVIEQAQEKGDKNPLKTYIDYCQANGITLGKIGEKTPGERVGLPAGYAERKPYVPVWRPPPPATFNREQRHALRLLGHRRRGLPGVSSNMEINRLVDKFAIDSGRRDLVRSDAFIRDNV